MGDDAPFAPLLTALACAISCLLAFAASARLVPWRRFFPRYGSLTAAERVDWNSRVVSALHTAASLVGFWRCSVEREGLDSYGSPVAAAFSHTETRTLHLMVTAGYLAYDLVLCLRYPSVSSPLTLVHHVVIIVAFGLGVATHFGTFYMCVLLVNEASTTFLNLRFFLLHLRLNGTAAYAFNGVCLCLSFLACRVLVTWALMAHIAWTWVTLWDVHWHALDLSRRAMLVFLTALAFVHAVVNLVWFRQIVGHALRNLRSGRAAAGRGVGQQAAGERPKGPDKGRQQQALEPKAQSGLEGLKGRQGLQSGGSAVGRDGRAGGGKAGKVAVPLVDADALPRRRRPKAT